MSIHESEVAQGTDYPFAHSILETRQKSFNNGYGIIAQGLRNGEVYTIDKVREILSEPGIEDSGKASRFLFHMASGRFFQAFSVPIYYEVYQVDPGRERCGILFYDFSLREGLADTIEKVKTEPIGNGIRKRNVARLQPNTKK
jgi:hypothetical protein